MSKIKNNSRLNQIFNDLESYRDFCVEYGYVFNEADLYNHKNYVYRQFQKFISGKPAKNQWKIDGEKFNGGVKEINHAR